MTERSKRPTERAASFSEPPTTVERPVKKTQPPPIPARKPPTQPPPIPARKPPTQPPMRASAEHEAAPLPDPPAIKAVALPHSPIIAVSKKSPAPGKLRAISKKSPAPGKLELERPRPQVKIRAMSEVSSGSIVPPPLGNLAPPRDLQETRARRARELLLWGSISVIIACAIALGIWFAAR